MCEVLFNNLWSKPYLVRLSQRVKQLSAGAGQDGEKEQGQ
jgi:hypothetical protein